MTNFIAFTKVKLPYGWLGNMSPHPIEFQEKTWPTAEHLFQALRFEFGHPVREEIRMQIGPMQSKFVAKRNRSLMAVVPRSQEDLDAMQLVLLLKIEQHPGLGLLLEGTEDLLIVEDVTSRPNESGLFWGAKRVGNEWVGENALGKTWMKIRARMQNPCGFDLTED